MHTLAFCAQECHPHCLRRIYGVCPQVGFVVGVPFCFVCFVGPEPGLVRIKAACGEIPDTLPCMECFIEDVIVGPRQALHEVLDARATSTYSMDELVLFPPQLRYFAGT